MSVLKALVGWTIFLLVNNRRHLTYVTHTGTTVDVETNGKQAVNSSSFRNVMAAPFSFHADC